MKDGSGGNLDSNRKYCRKLFWPMFYSWCNCPLKPWYFQQYLYSLAMGTDGLVPNSFMGGLFYRMREAFKRGDVEAARKEHVSICHTIT